MLNESSYFPLYNPKISALNSLYMPNLESTAENAHFIGIPILFIFFYYITPSPQFHYTYFYPRRGNDRQAFMVKIRVKVNELRMKNAHIKMDTTRFKFCQTLMSSYVFLPFLAKLHVDET